MRVSRNLVKRKYASRSISWREIRINKRASPPGAEARRPVGRAVAPQILGDGAGALVDSDKVGPAMIRILKRNPAK